MNLAWIKWSLALWATILLLNACKGSETSSRTNNSNKHNSNTVTNKHKGEQEFEAYLERKKEKFKGQQIPNVTVTTIKGKRYELGAIKNKVVLLNFWFAACKPCITEIPSLNELQNRFPAKDFLVLSVSIDKVEVAKHLSSKHNMRYAVAADGKKLADQLEVSTFPTSFLIDQSGTVQEVFIGASAFDATHTYTEVKPHVERLLN